MSTTRWWAGCISVLCGLATVATVMGASGPSSPDFRQAQNIDPSNITWTNGILQKTNSIFYEGMCVPQRVIMDAIPKKLDGTHVLKFYHLTSKTQGGQTHHAYDFLTSWQQAFDSGDGIAPSAAPLGPNKNLMTSLCSAACGDQIAADAFTICSALHAGACLGTPANCAPLTGSSSNCALVKFLTVDVPPQPGKPAQIGVYVPMTAGAVINDVFKEFNTIFSEGKTLPDSTIKIYSNRAINGTPTLQVNIKDFPPDGYECKQNGSDTDCYLHWVLTWTVTEGTQPTDTSQLILEYAGHLGIGNGDGTIFSNMDYGDNNGAGGISGGNYHHILEAIDTTGIGSRDNQIQASSILIPPGCSITCPPPICVGGNLTFTATATGSGKLAITWYKDGVALVSQPSGCTNLSSGGTCSLTITNAQLTDKGTYSVIVTNDVGGASTQDCSCIPVINPPPTVTPVQPDPVCANKDGATCFNLSATATDAFTSGTDGPVWKIVTQPAGCTLADPADGALTTQVCFPKGCTGTAVVSVTVKSNQDPSCGTDTKQINVTVKPNPTVTPVQPDPVCANKDGATCFNLSATATDAITSGADGPQWTIVTQPAGCTLADPADGALTTQVCFPKDCTGTAVVRVCVKSADQTNPICPGDCKDITLTVRPNPTVDLPQPDPVCENATGNTCFSLTATATNAFASGASGPTWKILSQTLVPDVPGTTCTPIPDPTSRTLSANVCFPQGCTGTADVQVCVTSNQTNPSCGPACDTATLTVQARPVAKAGDDNSTCQNLAIDCPTGGKKTATDILISPIGASHSPSNATVKWTIQTQPPGCTVSIDAGTDTTDNPVVRFPAGCTGKATLLMTVTSPEPEANRKCPNATDTVDLTVYQDPTCVMNPGVTVATAAVVVPGQPIQLGTYKVTGTITGGTKNFSCEAVIAAGVDWQVNSCSVNNQVTPATIEVILAPTSLQPSATLQVCVTVTDNNKCKSTCVQDYGITIGCDGPILSWCQNTGKKDVCTKVTGGGTNVTMEIYGPFTQACPLGAVDAVDQIRNSGKFVKSCSGLRPATGLETCLANVNGCSFEFDTNQAPGNYYYCNVVVDGGGVTGACETLLTILPNPACTLVFDKDSICPGDIATGTLTITGGTPDPVNGYKVTWTEYPAGFVPPVCKITASGGFCEFTTTITGKYTATVSDANECGSDPCSDTLEAANCACRVTGGGNDLYSVWPWDNTFASGHYKKGNSATDFYTFGGQAGAPCSTAQDPCNGPFGEWTHRQHKGDDGSFTFHAGTASSPDATRILTIRCSDNGACKAEANATQKQIDFDGYGSFKNIFGKINVTGAKVGKSIHYFSVHIEDAGEPGNKEEANSDNCPLFGSDDLLLYAIKLLYPTADRTQFVTSVNCICADFYRIEIWAATADPANPTKPDVTTVAPDYVVFGYLDGGNLQIHPPIDNKK